MLDRSPGKKRPGALDKILHDNKKLVIQIEAQIQQALAQQSQQTGAPPEPPGGMAQAVPPVGGNGSQVGAGVPAVGGPRMY